MNLRLRSRLIGPWEALSLIARALGRHELAGAWVARAATGRLRKTSNGRRTVLISGISRSGKSSVAAVLSARFGFRHIELDRFVKHAYAIKDRDARTRFREAFYTNLLARARTGHVIEGDDLVLEDRWNGSDVFGREALTLSILSNLERTFRLPTFVLGMANDSTDSIAASLSHGNSWVRELTEAERHDYALFLRRSSQQLRRLAGVADTMYLEIQTDDFQSRVAVCANLIAQAAE